MPKRHHHPGCPQCEAIRKEHNEISAAWNRANREKVNAAARKRRAKEKLEEKLAKGEA